ncbi:unnamed protein product [Bursaphelenchus xylophilus]|uniref:(pine wood nematode) hypothetical protein n=1 Tax=Bursaphelenchus xylophilus TaxID=6326 RepID=A0A1I7SWB5_BURXY|nr:unnamed protein product [Bursaphelenchus xylophilus]CAG9099141.1 unnamed protein product [Bursaphelenchus xylophilus]
MALPPPIVGNVTSSEEEMPRGHLIFDANFECGNLGRVDELSMFEYDLFIRPDTCNPKYRVWFYFSVKNIQQNQRIMFNVVNFSKLRNLFDTGQASPVYRECGDTVGEWSRIAPKNIYYYRSQVHGDRFILSFVHVFKNVFSCEFAYCIPYTYTQLQDYLTILDQRQMDYFKREVLCLTVQKRRVDLLTITSRENMLNETKKEKIVFITARVHPGESPSSHVIQGFLDYLLSDDKRAKRLRNLYVFKIVPMLNPDGVFLGNYRCSLMGFDLNRQWQHPSVWAHPTIAATKALLLHYNTNSRSEVVLCLDLHAHSQRTNSFLYGNLASMSPRKCDQQLLLPYALSELTDDYSLRYTQFNTDVEKAGTNRRTMGELLDDNCLCYTMEVSFFSYKPKDNQEEQAVPYLKSGYELLGRNLGIALLRYHDLQGNASKVNMDRDFESFLSKRCVRTYRASRNRSKVNERATD